MTDLTARVLDAGRAAGLAAVGVTTAEPFTDVKAILEGRKADGLSADMQFTYRNPERSTTPTRALEGARSLVVGAWPTANVAADDDREHRGRIGRYVWRDYYGELRVALETVAEVLRAHGEQARVVLDDNALVDRAAAVRAGLGWFGKNANVLVPGHGSWVVLGSIVTTAELTPSDVVADGCGPCTRCVDGCPTGAIVAPGVVDARRCLAWLVQAPGSFPAEFREALGDRIYGCDDCQEVCPPSRLVTRRAPAGEPTSVDLVALANATDEEILATHGRWYIAKRDPRYVRRNALVALGNTVDPTDDVACETVAWWADSADELLAEHAQWALRRIAERAAS